MNKIKKIFASIIGAAMTMSTLLTTVSVSASENVGDAEVPGQMLIDELAEAPEGYEFYCFLQSRDELRNSDSVIFQSIESPWFGLSYEDIKYNFTRISVADGVDKVALYETYFEGLGLGMYPISTDPKTLEVCELSEYGTDPRDASQLVVKQNEIMAACEEMYEKGLIESAFYTKVWACLTEGGFGRRIYLSGENMGTTEEDVLALAMEYTEDATCTYELLDDGRDYYTINVESLETFDEVAQLRTELEEKIAGATAKISYRLMEGKSRVIGSETVDILAALEAPEVFYGDINMDGKVSVLDIITISKANAQMISLDAAQTRAADCNGDGVVNADDLTALLYFIIEKIDVLPMVVE